MTLYNRIKFGFHYLLSQLLPSKTEQGDEGYKPVTLNNPPVYEFDKFTATTQIEDPVSAKLTAICNDVIANNCLMLYHRKDSNNRYVDILSRYLLNTYKTIENEAPLQTPFLKQRCDTIAKQNVTKLTRAIDEKIALQKQSNMDYKQKVLTVSHIKDVIAASKYAVCLNYLSDDFLQGTLDQLKISFDKGLVGNDDDIAIFIDNVMQLSMALNFDAAKLPLLHTHYLNTAGQVFNPNDYNVITWLLASFADSTKNITQARFNTDVLRLYKRITKNLDLPKTDETLNNTVNRIIKFLLSDETVGNSDKIIYQINDDLRFGCYQVGDNNQYSLCLIDNHGIYLYVVTLENQTVSSHELITITTAKQLDMVFILEGGLWWQLNVI